MRKVWNLPSQSHVSIVLSVSGVSCFYRIIYNRFMKFYKSGWSQNPILSHKFLANHLLLLIVLLDTILGLVTLT